jgi:hypothetical protein
MGKCEHGIADANAARKQITEGEKETSRLAGAGGAAESALMNAQTNAEHSGELRETIFLVHAISLQAKIRCHQSRQLFATTSVAQGLGAINGNYQ